MPTSSRALREKEQSAGVKSFSVGGTCTSEKSTAPHVKIPGTATESKQVGNVQIPGTTSGPKEN